MRPIRFGFQNTKVLTHLFMKEKIIAQLKAYLLTLGVKNLSTERMNATADRLIKKFPDLKEEDIDSKLSDLNDLNPFDEIARQDDRVRTLEAKAKETPKPPTDPANPGADSKKDDPPKPADEVPAWAKDLVNKINKLDADKEQEEIQKEFQKRMDGLKTKIPSTFYKGRKPAKKEDIETLATEIETDFLAFEQERNDGVLGSTTKPAGAAGASKNKASDKEVEELVQNIMPS